MHADHLLGALPPYAVCVVAALAVGVESLGIPFPGEIALVSAALLSSRHELHLSPWWVAGAGAIGAIAGDSLGFAVGRRFGAGLLARLAARFPRHFGPAQVTFAERIFARYGMRAVFFGRFISVLRILAGPVSGSMRLAYRRFLVANVLGGICWAGGTTAAIYLLGSVAARWLQRSSWIGLAVVAGLGLAVSAVVSRRLIRAAEDSPRADKPGLEPVE